MSVVINSLLHYYYNYYYIIITSLLPVSTKSLVLISTVLMSSLLLGHKWVLMEPLVRIRHLPNLEMIPGARAPGRRKSRSKLLSTQSIAELLSTTELLRSYYVVTASWRDQQNTRLSR